jgi:superfamily I DNA/RNA helicase
MSEVQLTPKQQEVVNFPDEGDLLVRGIPGAGKSTVLLARAHKQHKALLGQGRSNQVILVTYSSRLRQWMDYLARACGVQPPRVFTFHQLAGDLLRDLVEKKKTVEGSDREQIIVEAVEWAKRRKPHRLLEQETRFWSEEITWIKGRMLDRASYATASRSGRGADVRVTRADRDVIFDVYDRYQQLLRERGLRDYDDYAIELIKCSGSLKSKQVEHVLVDEAQDLYPAQVMALTYIARRSLTLAADKAQNIYRTGFSWKELGINIRGTRNKHLDATFRSTRDIMAVAMELRKQDRTDDEDASVAMPDRKGERPTLFTLPDLRDEPQFVADLAVKMWRARPNDTIAIISRAYRLRRFARALDVLGCHYQNLDGRSDGIGDPGIKLVSFHSAKGLEFDHVIVTGLTEKVLPAKRADSLEGEDLRDFLAGERRLLYVALTRARLTATMVAANPASPFLHEIPQNLYDVRNYKDPFGSPGGGRTAHDSLTPRQIFDPVAFFQEFRISVVDQRNVGGNLWVIAGAELTTVMNSINREHGWRFSYAPGGSKCTGNRPAWYTPRQK